jgi:hypothetical protein
LDLVEDDELEAAENLLTQLTSYGFFIVPVGEVEQWLKGLGISRSKATWLKKIFNAMGSDSNDDTYQKPDNDPVWDFVENLNKWLKNPKRKGIKK